MKALDWVETSEKTNSHFWLVWLPDHISMYRRLLDIGTEEAKKKYNEAKTEAKRVVRRAKNEELVQLGRELKKM